MVTSTAVVLANADVLSFSKATCCARAWSVRGHLVRRSSGVLLCERASKARPDSLGKVYPVRLELNGVRPLTVAKQSEAERRARGESNCTLYEREILVHKD